MAGPSETTHWAVGSEREQLSKAHYAFKILLTRPGELQPRCAVRGIDPKASTIGQPRKKSQSICGRPAADRSNPIVPVFPKLMLLSKFVGLTNGDLRNGGYPPVRTRQILDLQTDETSLPDPSE
jgi:hypothetical protein